MKRILLLLVLNITGWCGTYDNFLLETQLSLMPKIAILDKNLIFTHKKAPFKILIAYDRLDEEVATSSAKIMMKKLDGQINNHPIVINLLPYEKLETAASYHFIYILKGSQSQLKKAHAAADSSNAVSAMYDSDKLAESGLLLSIKMERKPVILINAKALREHHFSFPDNLLEIARIIE